MDITRTVSLSLITLMLGTPGRAAEIKLQPRVNVGGMYYEYEQQSLASPRLLSSGSGTPSLSSYTISSFMPTVSGGVTATYDQFFLDFGVQYGFDGHGTSSQQAEVLVPTGVAPLVRQNAIVDAQQDIVNDFSRLDYAISLGYRFTDNFSAYAGYKSAQTNARQQLRGTATARRLADAVVLPEISGDFLLDGDLDLEYDGPFIGGNYSVTVNQGWFSGVATGNVGLAFLDAVSLQSVPIGSFTNLSGVTVPASVAAITLGGVRPIVQGDTVGFSFGLTWKGLTSIKGLTYLVGATGYRYDFDSNSATSPSFTETLVRFDTGLAYRFDL